MLRLPVRRRRDTFRRHIWGGGVATAAANKPTNQTYTFHPHREHLPQLIAIVAQYVPVSCMRLSWRIRCGRICAPDQHLVCSTRHPSGQLIRHAVNASISDSVPHICTGTHTRAHTHRPNNTHAHTEDDENVDDQTSAITGGSESDRQNCHRVCTLFVCVRCVCVCIHNSCIR